MEPKIRKLAEAFMGDKINNLSRTDQRWVEMNFGRDYDLLHKVKLVNDVYEDIEKDDYRGLLRHLEESAGMTALAEGIYNDRPEFFDSLFKEEVEAKLEYGNYDTIDSIVEGRNFCIEEVEYCLRKFRQMRNVYCELS